MSGAGAQGRSAWPRAWHVAVVLLVCAAVYLPRLGAGGLTSTEGHRAIPGWEMLDSGNRWLPTMFRQAYLRKPPGVPWAIAASSRVFGETEFAARLPSALAMTGLALVTMVFGARWFGAGAGLAAGLAAALTPWFWASGRSAEIEALNNFGACAAVLLLIELCVNRAVGAGRPWAGSLLVAVLAGAAMTVAGLAKGPAAFAAIGSGAAVGVWMATPDGEEPRPVARVRVILWLALAAAIPAAIGWWVYTNVMAAVSEWEKTGRQAPIMQGVSDFLWSGRSVTLAGIAKVLAAGPAALLSALPASLALLLPWGSWARNREQIGIEGAGNASRASERSENRIARALVISCLASLGVLMALGVNNPRYAMPSICFVPVLAGYAWRWAETRDPARLGWIPVAALLLGAAVWIAVIEPRQRARSGREAGVAMAAAIADGEMIWADHMIEARPEVLWYAKREARRLGRTITPVWVPRMSHPDLLSLPRRGYLLLRTDPESGEEQRYGDAGYLARMTKVWEGRVHKFGVALYRKE